jgi:hypothetical protein
VENLRKAMFGVGSVPSFGYGAGNPVIDDI